MGAAVILAEVDAAILRTLGELLPLQEQNVFVVAELDQAIELSKALSARASESAASIAQ
jgi:hypothetical protein